MDQTVNMKRDAVIKLKHYFRHDMMISSLEMKMKFQEALFGKPFWASNPDHSS